MMATLKDREKLWLKFVMDLYIMRKPCEIKLKVDQFVFKAMGAYQKA